MKKSVLFILIIIGFTNLTYSQNQNGLVGKNDILFQNEGQINWHDSFLLQNQNTNLKNNEKGILYKPSFIYLDNNSKRLAYTYDTNGLLLNELLEHNLSATQWYSFSQYTYTYDSNGKMLTKLYKERKNQTLANLRLYTYTYNTDGKLSTSLYQIWVNEAWRNSSRYIYTYDSSGNMVAELYQEGSSGAFVDYLRYTYTYDTNGKMLTCMSESKASGVWEISYRLSYTYDSNGNILTELSESWKNGTWEISYRLSYNYDSDGDILNKLYEGLVGGVWVNSLRYTYTYDANKNLLKDLLEYWHNGTWAYDWEFNYTYDENNNTVTASLSGLNQPSTLTITYNNKKNKLSVSGFNCNVQYAQITGIKDEINNGLVFTLDQNYPNPFNPSTIINYSIPEDNFVTIKVYDVLGKEVTTLVDEEMPAGNYNINFDGSNLASGIYLYQIKTKNFTQTKKMVLMR